MVRRWLWLSGVPGNPLPLRLAKTTGWSVAGVVVAFVERRGGVGSIM